PPGPSAAGAGSTVGPYKLLQRIGEGGMGTVWMAEQEQPVRRRVALKLIKPGMDSARVLARFEQERQALALMDHPNIAKVFDFGVAKAAGGKLTDKTMFTEFGAVVGTFEYMAPEQASFNQLDVDTRADVYALGVLLYELLTGSTPLDRKRLRQAALDEVLRIIREEEPPRPSTRLSTCAELPAIAAGRRTEPARLSRLVRGEL